MKNTCYSSYEKDLSILITGKHKINHSLMLQLHNDGHSVFITQNSREALFIYASQQPDLIIFADPNSSYEIFENIREINQDARALFFVDVEDQDSLIKLFDFHETSYISHKASLEQILTTISRLKYFIYKQKANTDNSKLSDLILHSLPFPALLICKTNKEILLANKCAKNLQSDLVGHDKLLFYDDLPSEIKNCLIKDNNFYARHSFESLQIYGKFWNITIDQVAPDIFMLLAMDITIQRKELQLREEMERIARHDLRSPLANIVGMASILESDAELNEEYINLTEIIRTTSERMIRQIDASLTLVRLETGSHSPNPKEFNLLKTVKAAEGDLLTMIRRKTINVVYKLDNEIIDQNYPLICYGEPALITNLFSNLLKNGIEASPSNSDLTINFTEELSNIKTEIHNLGTIPTNIRSIFFERYATSGKEKGTGLGTYSAKLIAKASGGDISFISSEDEGTTLIINLPKS